MSSLVIRWVTVSDKLKWLRMRRLLWPNTDPANLAAELDSMLKDDKGAVFVAERPGASLCGLLEAGMRRYADGCETSPVGYIEGWYVDHAIRGRGIGAALIHEAEDWAASAASRRWPPKQN